MAEPGEIPARAVRRIEGKGKNDFLKKKTNREPKYPPSAGYYDADHARYWL